MFALLASSQRRFLHWLRVRFAASEARTTCQNGSAPTVTGRIESAAFSPGPTGSRKRNDAEENSGLSNTSAEISARAACICGRYCVWTSMFYTPSVSAIE